MSSRASGRLTSSASHANRRLEVPTRVTFSVSVEIDSIRASWKAPKVLSARSARLSTLLGSKERRLRTIVSPAIPDCHSSSAAMPDIIEARCPVCGSHIEHEVLKSGRRVVLHRYTSRYLRVITSVGTSAKSNASTVVPPIARPASRQPTQVVSDPNVSRR